VSGRHHFHQLDLRRLPAAAALNGAGAARRNTVSKPARLVLTVVSLLLAAPPLLAQGPPGGAPPRPVPATLTVAVDCDAGDRLADALAQRADELRVEVAGSCTEDVLIRRDRTTLVGVAPGAEIVASLAPPHPFGGGITVEGASRVTLTDLTVRGGRRGVSILGGGEAVLERLVLRDHFRDGLFLQGGRAHVANLVIADNGADGIGAWSSSNVILAADATTTVSGNGRAGVLVSGSSDLVGFLTSRLVSDENPVGLVVQLGASVQQVGLSAARNEVGVWALAGGSFNSLGELRDNTVGGLDVSDAGYAAFNGPIADNGAFGVAGAHDATVTYRGTLSGHAVGLALDGTEAFLIAATILDPVELTFGTQLVSAGGSTANAGVTCDGTVLTRGPISCPPPPAALGQARAASASGQAVAAKRGPLGLEP
jgi:hypothetical protein